MIQKDITYFHKPAVLACDAKCDKAWGINYRRRESFDEEDDYAFLADDELGRAPKATGIWEGLDGKPRYPDELLNKWCARECERSSITKPGETIVLPDFSKRVYNQPWKHEDLQ